jgi:hypothetical protein
MFDAMAIKRKRLKLTATALQFLRKVLGSV